MVQIYRWSELVNRQFASQENLARARAESISLMKKLHKRGWIESAAIIGSVARGDYSVGSDFDVLVISKPESQPAVERYLQRVFRLSLERLGVKPELIHINAREARTGEHSIDLSLLQHMKANIRRQTTVGKDPVRMIRIPRADLLTTKRDRTLFFIHSARKALVEQSFDRTHDRDAYYKTLGRTIDRTIHSARYVLSLRRALPKIRGKVDDRKQTVVNLYSRLFSGNRVAVKALQSIVAANDAYQRALANAVKALKSGRKPSIARAKAQYHAALKGLEACVPTNLVFLSENVKIMNSMKRTKRRKPLSGRKRACVRKPK